MHILISYVGRRDAVVLDSRLTGSRPFGFGIRHVGVSASFVGRVSRPTRVRNPSTNPNVCATPPENCHTIVNCFAPPQSVVIAWRGCYERVSRVHMPSRAQRRGNAPQFAMQGNLNFQSPNTFAKITSIRDNPNDPREIQLALNFYW
jgi:hypothetical protein